jgi:hypothetical protein
MKGMRNNNPACDFCTECNRYGHIAEWCPGQGENEMNDAKVKAMRDKAITVLELTKGFTPEQRETQTNAFHTMEELAGDVLILTADVADRNSEGK